MVHDLRNWTRDRHRTVDDRTFGGGPGMVLKIEPVVKAVRDGKPIPNGTVLALAILAGFIVFVGYFVFFETIWSGQTPGKRLVGLLDPEWLRIGAYWYPRGGIPIDVFWQTGQPPKDLFIPDAGKDPAELGLDS